jgi:hypothetical protein
MKSLRQLLRNIDFALVVLLVFLFLFRDHLTLPAWVQAAGRMHPMVLHFPIVLLIAAWPLYLWLHRLHDDGSVHEALEFLLLATVFFSTLSALSGLFLSAEGGYDETILYRHRATGMATAIFSYALLYVYTHAWRTRLAFHLAAALSLVSLVMGGHYGAILTHGDGFITGPLTQDEAPAKIKVTDSTAVYAAVVTPIMASKCYACHNEKKAKGGLVMTAEDKLLKGGKNGAPWVKGKPDESLIIQRLLLPSDDKKHMPPADRSQLNAAEIALLHDWVLAGASLTRTFREYPQSDSFRGKSMAWAKANQEVGMDTVTYPFKEADAKVIEKLNGATRSVQPIALHSPALSVQFFIRQLYKPAMLEELDAVRQQVVQLNMGGMPVTDDALKTLAKFTNLEKLILNGSELTGKDIGQLKACTRLRSIAVSSTKMDAGGLGTLAAIPSLKEVYAWNTKATPEQLAALQQQHARIKWFGGYQPDASEQLQLTPPMSADARLAVLQPGATFGLRHPMPGVSIRYTTDGSNPDSASSTLYKSPIAINALTTVKAIAVREGWRASGVSTFTLFIAGISPDSASLLTLPDEKYLANREASLTDGLKGDPANLAINWLAYRERPMNAVFHMGAKGPVKEVTLSSLVNTGPYIFPPLSIEVRGGADAQHLKPIGSLRPTQPVKNEDNHMVPFKVSLRPGNYPYIEVRVQPLPSLPPWHPGKKEKAWFFVDEVFFN